jgi:hypothetical protein
LQTAGSGQQNPRTRANHPLESAIAADIAFLVIVEQHQVLPPLRPLGRLTSVNQAGGRFIPIYIVRNLQKLF